MPKGPRGEKRPGDVIDAAIMVAKIATGKVGDTATPIEEARRAGHAGFGERTARLREETRGRIKGESAALIREDRDQR